MKGQWRFINSVRFYSPDAWMKQFSPELFPPEGYDVWEGPDGKMQTTKPGVKPF